jgi:DNA-binding CsgD family transcriptional regulator
VPPNLRTTLACAEYLRARPEEALRVLGDVEREPLPGDQLSGKLTTLVWPAMFAIAARGPSAARPMIERARRLTAERGAAWIMPFHAFVAGGAAVATGEWDVAVAELDTGLDLAQEQGSGWISIAVGQRAYVDAHRGRTGDARRRLDALRRCGVPLQFGLDFPGLADLAVLEADGATRAAATLARELWAAAPARGEAWMLALAPDVARVALAALEHELLGRVAAQVGAVEAPQECAAAPTAALTAGMAAGAPEPIEQAARAFDASGNAFAAAQAWEEYASLVAAGGDRAAAVAAMERALRTYDCAGASADRGRLLSRLRTFGVRRGPRSPHATASTGWAALTPTERRIAGLVREGRTNPEIAAQLYVSPRTVQTHVSHILAKLGARSRVEVAATAPAG